MTRRNTSSFWTCLAGGLFVAGLGAVLVQCPMGDGLARLSYDLPFLFHNQVPTNVVMVYLDPAVQHHLGQTLDRPLDRRFHARLLDRLTKEGAQLVLLDFLFDEPQAAPSADQELADALRRHGRAVLVASHVETVQLNLVQETPVPPLGVLTNAARGWGLARLKLDPDSAVRLIDPGTDLHPSAGWTAARLLGAPVREEERLAERWLNYYGPPDELPAVNYDHALAEPGLPAGFFRDKIVVVGVRPAPGGVGAAREEFANPYSRFGRAFSTGAAIHALTLLNVWRADWLVRLPPGLALTLTMVLGLLLGAGLTRQRPGHAAGIALATAVLVVGVSGWVQLRHRFWWPWLVPVAAQVPAALAWSLGSQYAVEFRKRRRLRDAFAAYLSPHLADRIAASDFDLSLGGRVVEATVMFTDLEGFTALSETLPPDEVSRVLVSYFSETTHHILNQDGTIIKYMGDAVQAVWGAPLPDANQAEHAVRAALGIVQASGQAIAGRRWRTRVGLHTGPVLAGNLGSRFRFDYAVVGATTNLASRLEGLNKALGTSILITAATRQRLRPEVQLRFLGRFLLKDISSPVEVFEVLSLHAEPAPKPDWVTAFERGVAAFQQGQLAQAEARMREALTLRGRDGPAEFYLARLAVLPSDPASEPAGNGIIRIDTK